jgi:two-component system, chemotaxis family, sensor kinase CheA
MMEHFRQTFRDEADELLVELEHSLLELEQNPADDELIDRVFRAMHTLKGSSAMFGFDDIAAFSHEVETVLDLVRDGKTGVTKELIGLTLQARDQIKAMIKVSVDNGELDVERTEELVAAFHRLVGTTVPVPVPADFSPSASNQPGDTGMEILYAIRFRPDRDIFKRGLNPVQLLNDLHELGLCRITAKTNDIPPLADIDPELCYLQWDIMLTTRHGVDAIRDIFMFVGEESSVEIEVIPGESTEDVRTSRPEMPGQAAESGKQRTKALKSITSIRVAAEKLDQLVNLVGELVTAQARLSQTALAHNDTGLIALAEEIERLTEGLRDTALNVRMLPIGGTFGRMRRLVHDLSSELGKDVELITEGAETELDKAVIERLADPLVHLIRNSIDHGIETPTVRMAAGKPPCGTIRLTAAYSGASVLLTLSDDGAGIDREAVHARGVKMGLISAGTELPDRELLNLIFAPGFSTSAKITNISGRGVGMDVVKRGVEALRGSISITSTRGEGATVSFRIPLTLAIIESLLVQIGTTNFIVPLSLVEECIELTRTDVARAHGRRLVDVRGAIIPYISLRERFSIGGVQPEIEQIVVVEVDGKRIGLVVDHVIGGHQTVIKSLGRLFREAQGVSGATMLGDGTVALILDVPQLVGDEEVLERRTFGNAPCTEKGTMHA